jgi:hypothetical protein
MKLKKIIPYEIEEQNKRIMSSSFLKSKKVKELKNHCQAAKPIACKNQFMGKGNCTCVGKKILKNKLTHSPKKRF